MADLTPLFIIGSSLILVEMVFTTDQVSLYGEEASLHGEGASLHGEKVSLPFGS